ncbi:MAG: hypothetical protein OQL09_09930 [Gammaproteobacteria bacterium]|nr:hypothetical protein [Gammaproteobacteria bacterium]
MPLFMPTIWRFYKISAIVGTLLIISTLIFSWLRVEKFESTISDVFEGIVTVRLEVDGLKEQLQHIDNVLSVVSKNNDGKEIVTVDGIEYSSYEIKRLRSERSGMMLHIKEKELELEGNSDIKQHVMNEVRLLFISALSFLVLGTLMAAFGYLGWYFKIEMLEDRRRRPR